MERRQIEYFVAVADHGGFSRAATAMNVTQSALSQSIAQLEREFRVELFFRTPRGAVLTAAGLAAIGPARQSLRGLHSIRSAVDAVLGLSGGILDLAALPSLAQWPMSTLVAEFRAAHPAVKITIQGSQNARVPETLEMVRAGRCELALTEEGGDTTGLVSHSLGEQEYVAVLPHGTPLAAPGIATWDEILAGGLIVGPWWETSTPYRLFEQRYGRELQDRIAIRTDHREAYLPLVVSGAGTAILPRMGGPLAASSGALVAKISPPIKRSVVLVHPEGPLLPAGQAFLDIALAKPGTI